MDANTSGKWFEFEVKLSEDFIYFFSDAKIQILKNVLKERKKCACHHMPNSF